MSTPRETITSVGIVWSCFRWFTLLTRTRLKHGHVTGRDDAVRRLVDFPQVLRDRDSQSAFYRLA